MTKVEITSATECKTLNPLGEHPIKQCAPYHSILDLETYTRIRENWQLEEDKREVYKIENWISSGFVPTYNNPDGFGISEEDWAYPLFVDKIGEIVEAKLKKETKKAIIL